MDSELKRGHGPGEAHESVLRRCSAALEDRDVDRLISCSVELFEPLHDDSNAKHFLELAAEGFPADARPLFWLARLALYRDSDETQAGVLLNRALEREPDRPECLLMLAPLLIESGEIAAAASLVKRLLKVADDWPNTFVVSGQLQEHLGERALAYRSYQQALRLLRDTSGKGHPDSYFERVVTGRRAESAIREWLQERLGTLVADATSDRT